MKKSICCLITLVLCLTCFTANASSLKYMEYYKAVNQIEGIFADFIRELHTQLDEEGNLSDVELALYFSYAKTLLDLREVEMLQSNAAFSDSLESYNESTKMVDDTVRQTLEDALSKWEKGEFTKNDAIDAVRPLMEILIDAE